MASTNRRAAPARSRRTAPRGSKRRTGPKQKKKFFDYPRSGYHGLHRWLPSWRVLIGTALGVAFLSAGVVVAAYAFTEIPSASADDVKAQTTTVYFAPHDDGTPGSVMGTFATQKRTIVKYDTLPKYVGEATAAGEDKTFYSSSSGVSVTGMGRALINNLKGGRTEGGSTLTQQYVERYYVGTTTTDYVGKAKETLMAIKIARTQTKAEIMGRYLNSIYYGRDSYGIQAAAQSYFGVDASALTVEQAALLAAIIPSPNNWDPANNPSKAEQRWSIVLDSMQEQGWVTGEARAAMVFPTTVTYQPADSMGGTNGYLLEMVKKEMRDTYNVSDDDLPRAGYSITTTIKEDMQALAVDHATKFAAGQLDGQDGVVPDPGIRASLTTIDPTNGAVLALYGGPDLLADPKNRATFDMVQAGSTFKPFTLISALEQGIPLSTKFDGHSPQKIEGFDKPLPNFGNEQPGTIDLVKATADSINTVYAQLNLQVGPDVTAATATKAGIESQVNQYVGNVLGTDYVHPIEMASAYATIANGGTRHDRHIVASVKNSDGVVAYQPDTTGTQEFDPLVIADTTYAMQQVVQSGTGKTWIKPLKRPIAGKTGTTNGNISAWFVGFTPDLVTEVSLSNPTADGAGYNSVTWPNGKKEPKGVTGATWPAFLWQSYMKEVFKMPAYSAVLDFPERANVGVEKKPSTEPEPTETLPPPPTEAAPQQVAVPSGLEGKLEADATATVINAGLAPTIVSESSDTVTAGRVIRVDPGSGTTLDTNGTVTLVISTGPKAVVAPPPVAPPVVPAVPAAP